jgi:hypothetical protein
MDKQQATKGRNKRTVRRTREAVRSAESLKDDAKAADRFLSTMLDEQELGGKVARDHVMKIPEGRRVGVGFRYDRIATCLGVIGHCYPANACNQSALPGWRYLLAVAFHRSVSCGMKKSGKQWLNDICRAEALRVMAGIRPNPETPSEIILSENLTQELAIEWVRDSAALVAFLESLIASYARLEKTHYDGRVIAAMAMSAGRLRTEKDDWDVRGLYEKRPKNTSLSKNFLNDAKRDIRKAGKESPPSSRELKRRVMGKSSHAA